MKKYENVWRTKNYAPRGLERRDDARTSDPDALMRWAMGMSFPLLRGRVDPSELAGRLRRALGLEETVNGD